jgi:hypothetical protein
MTESEVKNLTTGRVYTVTRPAVSLHQRNAAKGETGMTETCMMSSAIEMHVVKLKTSTESECASSRNDAMRGTLITMVPSMTNLTDNAPLKEGAIQEESKLSLTT